MQEFLEFTFRSFWHFMGIWVLASIPFRFVIHLIRAISDWSNTRKHGWNPNPSRRVKLFEKEDKDND